jgi:hypothetical protein
MKKILIGAVMMLAGFTLKAQSGIHSNFGIKAGAQAAKLGQPVVNWDTKYRWHAGLLAHLHMSRHFAIQPELIYSAQGAEHITTTTDTQIELGYLNVPIVFQYMTGSGFRFQAGPQIGFLVNADRDINSVESDIKSSIKKTDFGVLAGVSYVTKMGLGFDARYVYGKWDLDLMHVMYMD